ncbi:MAG: four helix bundle protein [Balneola sp.]
MKSDNIIQTKSYDFALRIIKLNKYLVSEQKEFSISRQLLRSGTSIGANVEEAIGGTTKKDFKYKLSISYREARESHYWIRLLRDSNYVSQDQADSLLKDCDELLKIIGSIIKTTKTNLRN